MSDPRPRPALHRAADGQVRPAPPRLATFAAGLPPARATADDRPSRVPEEDRKAGERSLQIVELKVRMPRGVRKALRVRAEAAGYTAEDAAYHLVRSWLHR